jgi:hypothetical protein
MRHESYAVRLFSKFFFPVSLDFINILDFGLVEFCRPGNMCIYI